MAYRLHPWRRVRVGKPVFKLDSVAQFGESRFVVSLTVLQFAVEHRRSNAKHVDFSAWDAVQSGCWNNGAGSLECGLFRLSLCSPAQSAERDASRVQDDRSRCAIQSPIGGELEAEDFISHAKANHNVGFASQKTLYPVCHGDACFTKQPVIYNLFQPICSGHCVATAP